MFTASNYREGIGTFMKKIWLSDGQRDFNLEPSDKSANLGKINSSKNIF